MIKKITILITVVLLLLIVLFLNIGTSNNSPIVLNFGHDMPKESSVHEAALHFKRLVEKETKEKIRIDIFPAQKLGSDSHMTELVRAGKLAFAVPPTSKVEIFSPKMELLSLPYLFKNRRSLYDALDSEFGEYIFSDLIKNDMTFLGLWESGFKQISSNLPINKLSDFTGAKFRVMASDLLEQQTINLSAFPEIVDFHQLREKIKSKEIDILENPINTIYSMDFYKHHPNLLITDHGYLGQVFIGSNKILKKLDPRYVSIIKNSAIEVSKKQREYAVESQKSNLEKIKKYGVKVNDSTEAFKLEFIKSQRSLYYSYREDLLRFKSVISPLILGDLKESLVVGVNLSFSATSSDSAISIKRGVDMAISDINENGGINGKRVLAFYLNHESFPRKGIENIKRLSSIKGLIGIIGGMHSPVVLSEREIVNTLNTPYVIPWAAASPIISPKNPNIYRVSLRDQYAASALYRKAISKGNKIVLVLENTGWGESNLKALTNIANSNPGAKIHSVVRFDWGEKNFTEVHKLAKSLDEAVFIFVGNSPEGSHFVKSLLSSNMRFPVVSHWGITGGNFWKETKDFLPEIDLNFITTYPQDFPSQKIKKFFEDYKNIYGLTENSYVPSFFGTVHSYDAVKILTNSIEKEMQLDFNNINDRLSNLPFFEGLTGRYTNPFNNGKVENELFDQENIRFGRFDSNGNIKLSE